MPYFDQFIAISPETGNYVRNATFTAYDPEDTEFTTPLTVRNLAGSSITLMSDGAGKMPAQWTVDGGLTSVVLKSGSAEIQVSANLFEETKTARDEAVAAASSAVALQDSTIAGRVTASGSLTQNALDDRYRSSISVRSFGATGDGDTNDIAAVIDAIEAAVALGVKSVIMPAGEYYLPDDVELPRGVALIGAGMNATILKGTGEDRLVVKGGSQGVGADWGGPSITNLTLHGMGVVFGDTEDDWGNGASLADVEIRYTTVGLTLRYNTWSFRGQNLRIHQCSVAAIKHDFAPVTQGSGSNIVYSECVIFNCGASGFWQNGIAVDGCHVSFVNVNIENCGTSYVIESVGTGGSTFEITNGHFESNNTSYIRADSGLIWINGAWMFDLRSASSTRVAEFDLSGTAQVRLMSGRISWGASSRLYRLRDTAQFIVDTENTVLAQIGMDAGIPGDPFTSDSTGGVKLRRGVSRSSQTAVAVAHSSTVRVGSSHAYDTTVYEVEYHITLAGMGASNNLVTYVRSATGGATFSHTMPTAATQARVRLTFAPLIATIEYVYDTGDTYVSNQVLTHTAASARYVEMTVGGAGSATGSIIHRSFRAV